jgi:hypothetical protein
MELYPCQKSPRDLLARRLGEPQSRSGRWGEEKNLALLGTEPGPYSLLYVVIPLLSEVNYDIKKTHNYIYPCICGGKNAYLFAIS